MSGFLRWLIQAICLILLLVCIPLTVTGLWVRSAVFDTDQYSRAIAPLTAEASVQTAVTAQIMTALDGLADPGTDDPNLRQQLIQRGYEQNRDRIESAVKIVIGSPEFDQTWLAANRAAHDTIVRLLRGENLPNVDNANGAVTIDLAAAYANVQEELEANGIDVLAGITPRDANLSFTIFRAEQLDGYRAYLRLLNRGTIAIAILTALLAVGFIWTSATFWRGVFWLAVVIAVTMTIVFAGLDIVRDATAGSISNEVNRAAAEDIFDGVTATLKTRTGVFALGASVLFVAMFVVSRFRRPQRLYG